MVIFRILVSFLTFIGIPLMYHLRGFWLRLETQHKHETDTQRHTHTPYEDYICSYFTKDFIKNFSNALLNYLLEFICMSMCLLIWPVNMLDYKNRLLNNEHCILGTSFTLPWHSFLLIHWWIILNVFKW